MKNILLLGLFSFLINQIFILIAVEIVYTSCSLPTETILKKVKKYLPENPTILEAGARFGEDTIVMSNFWPFAQIYSFEPLPTSYERLLETTKRFNNVHCYPFALSDKKTRNIFYPSSTRPGASSLLKPSGIIEQAYDIPPIHVDCIRLDDWIRENKIDKIDFMWLDLEGTELIVLDSIKDTPAFKTVKVIYTEVNFRDFHNNCSTYLKINDFLEKEGFVEIFRREEKYWQGESIYLKKNIEISISNEIQKNVTRLQVLGKFENVLSHPNQIIDGKTPLHFAVEKNINSILRTLIEYGADPTSNTAMGIIPYYYAKRLKNKEAEEILRPLTINSLIGRVGFLGKIPEDDIYSKKINIEYYENNTPLMYVIHRYKSTASNASIDHELFILAELLIDYGAGHLEDALDLLNIRAQGREIDFVELREILEQTLNNSKNSFLLPSIIKDSLSKIWPDDRIPVFDVDKEKANNINNSLYQGLTPIMHAILFLNMNTEAWGVAQKSNIGAKIVNLVEFLKDYGADLTIKSPLVGNKTALALAEVHAKELYASANTAKVQQASFADQIIKILKS